MITHLRRTLRSLYYDEERTNSRIILRVYNYLRKKSIYASTVFPFFVLLYLAHRCCGGYGRADVYEPGRA